MKILDEMWALLPAYQPQADAAGHGDSWAKMCREKTFSAATKAVANAKATRAADAAGCAARAAAVAACAVWSSDAAVEMWAQMAVNRINKAMEKNT